MLDRITHISHFRLISNISVFLSYLVHRQSYLICQLRTVMIKQIQLLYCVRYYYILNIFMLITNFFHFGIHMFYNEPVYGATSPRGHTQEGVLPSGYGTRGSLGTILLINNYNRYCCQMSQILWYYIA